MSDNKKNSKALNFAFEDRILAEHAKLRSSAEALWDKVEKGDPGQESRAVMKKMLGNESHGHLYFGAFAHPPVVERARGAKMWDVDGKEYIDFHSGFSVNNLGHCNPEVNEAVKAQIDKLQHFAELPVRVRAEFGEAMLSLLPWDYPKKCQFTVTGGEAVEVAMKLCRWYTGKQLILTQYGDYHGRTAGAQALTGKCSMMHFNYPVLPADSGIFRFHFAYCYRCPYGHSYPSCDMRCVKILDDLFQNKEAWLNNPAAGITNVAGMIVEPFQSSAGYIIPPPEYLQGLKRLCDKYGFLFVSDEVQNGMARTGKMWAIEHSGVTPDLITVAKSVSNGLPISLTLGRKEVLDSWGPGGHNTTFCGYPVACAGGLKVAEIMKRDRMPDQVAEKGHTLEERLKALYEKHPLIGTFDLKGLYAGIELVRDRKTKEPAAKETGFVHAACLKEGLICVASGYHYNRLGFLPPLVISREELDYGLEIFDRVLTQAEEKFEIRRPVQARSALPEAALKA